MKRLIPPLSQLTIYVAQYLLLPLLVTVYPTDTTTIYLLVFSSAFLVSGIAMLRSHAGLSGWLISVVLYPVLVALYHPEHWFGIGYGMFALPAIMIMILSATVLLGELAAFLCVKVGKRLFHLS